MTLKNFQIFIEVCNQGTMSAAAKKMFISQSAISQIISEMERHYNTVLFRRVSHKLYLTESGRKLYNHALKIVQYNETIESEMADNSTLASLRIGSVSAYIMIDLVAEYKNFHPELSVSMVNNTRNSLDQLLTSSQIDVAIVGGLFNLDNYDFYPLIDMDTIIACNKNTKLSHLLVSDSPEITIEQLSRLPLYLSSVSGDVEQSLSTAFLSRGIHYNVAGTFLHYDAVVRTAIEDLGIVLINSTNFEHSRQFLKEIHVKDLHIINSLSMVCSKQNSSNPLIRDFISFSQENFDYVKAHYSSQSYSFL